MGHRPPTEQDYELKTILTMFNNIFLRFLQVVALCLLPPALKVAYDLYTKLRKPCDLPVMNLSGWRFEEAKQRYISHLWDYLKLGREESPNQAIQLYGPEGYVVVVPEHFVEEMKALDDSVSDNRPLFTDILSDFLFFDISKGHIMRKVVSSKLNVKLADLLPEIVAETAYAMNLKLPATDDWIAVNINKELSQIVSLISGRIFVGSHLNRDEEWMETNITFSEDIYAAGVVLKKRSYFHKLITVWFSSCPELQRMDKCKAIAHRLFIPMIKQRERLLEKDPNYPLPNDAITWVMSMSATDHPRPTYEQQAELQLMLSMASIHTSRTTLTNALYDLLSRPEYLNPLRAEVDALWNPTTGIDKTTPSQLILLDSFLKESQRLTPVGQLTFDRRITSRNGLTLSNGLHLRHGTHVAVAAHQISLDTSIWGADASSFNGFRFSDLRKQSPQNANKFQFASTDSTSALNFGFGNHDCPGRHFASTEIKCILAYMLRTYDMKAPEDWEGKRPETAYWAQRMSPDSERCIMMRRRRWES